MKLKEILLSKKVIKLTMPEMKSIAGGAYYSCYNRSVFIPYESCSSDHVVPDGSGELCICIDSSYGYLY
jgi:hypothetical protein